MVIGTLYVNSFLVHALIDPGSTLSFVTPLVVSKFDLYPRVLHEGFLVSTAIGDNIKAKRVYRDCQITLLDRVT